MGLIVRKLSLLAFKILYIKEDNTVIRQSSINKFVDNIKINTRFLIATTEESKQVEENINNIHVQHHGRKNIILRANLMPLAAHYQLGIKRQELEKK